MYKFFSTLAILMATVTLFSNTSLGQNSFGFGGQSSNSINGWWKIKADIPVYLFGTKVSDAPLWGYIGFENNGTGETWEYQIDGTSCRPRDFIRFTWKNNGNAATLSQNNGYTVQLKITWVDQNTFQASDPSGTFIRTYMRAIDGWDAKCNWFSATCSQSGCPLPTNPCGTPPPPPDKTCGQCVSKQCHDCSACSGTGRVWNAQDGKWYTCNAHGCGVLAPKGKICN
ncbi:MAG: lipocalin family protein [Chitinophagales bacterium]|nr:lipocalin family protein [Chitinophagales bacterium]